MLIQTKNLSKIYNPDKIPVTAIDNVSIEFQKGEFTAIVGPSGCGKTTLLNLLGGLDKPSEGEVIIENTTLNNLNESQLTDYRLKHIGFVFQSYNLIPVLTAEENVEFIMLLQKKSDKERKERVSFLMERMGMKEQMNRKPSELSGGQQQRVAVARALASKPFVILADEPTANLDSVSTKTLLDLMSRMNEEEGATFIFSTHDSRVIEKARRVVTLQDGKIISDETR